MSLSSREFVMPVTIGRDEFARDYFDYRPGQHVLFGGPTQRGKTTLAFKLLEYVATADCPAYVAVSKPSDPVTSREMQRLGYRLVREWPPKTRVLDPFREKPSGYVIWPKFGDMKTDREKCAVVTRALLEDRYTQGVKGKPGILVCDDTMVKSKILGLDSEMTTHIAMSGAMKLGGWYFVQKPTGSGQAAIWSYGNSEHVFLYKDPERRNRQRYDEIGGIDSHYVEDVTMQLEPYQALYIRRTGSKRCIIDAQ